MEEGEKRKLVEHSDLGIPYTTALNRSLVRAVQSLLGINKINALHENASDKKGAEFAQDILDQLGVVIECDQNRLNHIPQTGPFVVVANHPHGALDGLLLITLITSIRPDVKFLGNFLLTRIGPLNDFFLAVDPFDTKNKRNISGIRRAITHLQQGSPLVIFPAGEVSTFRKGFGKIEDKSWSSSVMKLILQAGVPVVPIYIGGGNSLKFHLLGKIHPMFRTIRLPLELINKDGESVAVAIGSPVSAKRLAEIKQIQSVSNFLRANVYSLKLTLTDPSIPESSKRPKKRRSKKETSAIIPEEIAKAGDKLLISSELNSISPQRILLQAGGISLFFTPASEIPVTMREIARLREVTFREAGEGTLLESDSDQYDDLYQHLFLWDNESLEIIGAYRIGFGDQLFEARGFDGFYTYTLFEFSRHLTPVLCQSIELGRSFIVPEHQRRPQVLLLLWRGILSVLLQNPSYRYLLGPVSMSGAYSSAAKWMVIDYIKTNYWDVGMAKSVVPRNGLSTLGSPALNPDLIRGVTAMEDIEKLIRDIEPMGVGMPILMKKYLQMGGKVIGFNVDPLFNDSLDALLILDLTVVPKEKIDMLAREMISEEVHKRFRAENNR